MSALLCPTAPLWEEWDGLSQVPTRTIAGGIRFCEECGAPKGYGLCDKAGNVWE